LSQNDEHALMLLVDHGVGASKSPFPATRTADHPPITFSASREAPVVELITAGNRPSRNRGPRRVAGHQPYAQSPREPGSSPLQEIDDGKSLGRDKSVDLALDGERLVDGRAARPAIVHQRITDPARPSSLGEPTTWSAASERASVDRHLSYSPSPNESRGPGRKRPKSASGCATPLLAPVLSRARASSVMTSTF
jgi:hypothetical protein